MKQSTNRIIFNTVVLYAKILICMVISLWTVPLLLDALGASDYGLYNLVAGVVVMLSFMNGAMTISTQRYLSVTIGERDKPKLLEVYNMSILLHVVIGLIVALLVEICAPLLIHNVMNMEAERVDTAYALFHYFVVSMFFTIIVVPFDAVLNAYENMLVFSIVGVVEAVLKLIVALLLPYLMFDRLNFYGVAIMVIAIIVFLLKMGYVIWKYDDLRFSRQALKNMSLFWELFGFAGWNTISSLAIMVRNQGLAVVLNYFFSTVINAAYGIGNQINGVLCYFSTTIQKSVNPQLMESQGTGDYGKLKTMTYGLTKFSTLSMALVALPLLVEMPNVLNLWMDNVPPHTVSISRLIIVLSLIYQMSSGLMSAIQSTGKIKYYTTTIGLLLLSTIPVAYAFLASGCVAEVALWVACFIEAVAMAVRLVFAKRLVGLSISEYLVTLVVPMLLMFVGVGACLWLFTLSLAPSFWRLLLTCSVDVVLFCGVAYKVLFNEAEKNKTRSMVSKVFHR